MNVHSVRCSAHTLSVNHPSLSLVSQLRNAMSHNASRNCPASVQNARFPLSKWRPPSKHLLKKTLKVLLRRRQGCPSSHFQGKTQSAWATVPLFILPHRARGRILGATKPHPLTAQMGQQGLERLTCLSPTRQGTNSMTEWKSWFPDHFIPHPLLILLTFFIPLLRYYKTSL